MSIVPFSMPLLQTGTQKFVSSRKAVRADLGFGIVCGNAYGAYILKCFSGSGFK